MEPAEFRRFLATRSSVRKYRTGQPDPEILSYVLECASLAPSAGNREAWDIVVVTDEGIREALSLASFSQEHVASAPVVFVVCANYVRSMSQYGDRGILYAVQDATIAATYVMLACHERGIQTCWIGAFEEDEVRELLGLPGHVRPVAMLAAGHGELPPYRTGRMPVEEHIHRERWVTPGSD